MSDEPVAVRNYLESADTAPRSTRLLSLGRRRWRRTATGSVLIRGVGLHAPLEATGGLLDVGNSGTLMRLLPGWLAGQPGRRVDARRRRVDPAPARWTGSPSRWRRWAPGWRPARAASRRSRSAAPSSAGIDYELPVASAQVKSCVLIAGMLADGSTTVVEAAPSRDHTERMLRRARVPFERGRAAH